MVFFDFVPEKNRSVSYNSIFHAIIICIDVDLCVYVCVMDSMLCVLCVRCCCCSCCSRAMIVFACGCGCCCCCMCVCVCVCVCTSPPM